MRFLEVGLGTVVWIGEKEANYTTLDIFLLPGQMIPEHSHLGTDKGAPKMESWQPRRGMIYTFGEGEPTPEFLRFPKLLVHFAAKAAGRWRLRQIRAVGHPRLAAGPGCGGPTRAIFASRDARIMRGTNTAGG